MNALCNQESVVAPLGLPALTIPGSISLTAFVITSNSLLLATVAGSLMFDPVHRKGNWPSPQKVYIYN